MLPILVSLSSGHGRSAHWFSVTQFSTSIGFRKLTLRSDGTVLEVFHNRILNRSEFVVPVSLETLEIGMRQF